MDRPHYSRHGVEIVAAHTPAADGLRPKLPHLSRVAAGERPRGRRRRRRRTAKVPAVLVGDVEGLDLRVDDRPRVAHEMDHEQPVFCVRFGVFAAAADADVCPNRLDDYRPAPQARSIQLGQRRTSSGKEQGQRKNGLARRDARKTRSNVWSRVRSCEFSRHQEPDGILIPAKKTQRHRLGVPRARPAPSRASRMNSRGREGPRSR